MFAPEKIEEVRPSCPKSFGAVMIVVSESVWRAERSDPIVRNVLPLCLITSPITPRSKPVTGGMLPTGVGGVVADGTRVESLLIKVSGKVLEELVGGLVLNELIPNRLLNL